MNSPTGPNEATSGHRAEEYPWNFYFNGLLMPKWGACWHLAGISKYLDSTKNWDNEVGHRDVYIVQCQIAHVGVAESADPDVFIYAVQEVLCILLEYQNSVRSSISEGVTAAGLSVDVHTVYTALISAAFQMRRIASEQRLAFWMSGYEADRLQLLEAMHRSLLPPEDQRYLPAPHLQHRVAELKFQTDWQRKRLRKLAQSGSFDKETRRELHSF